MSLEWLNKAAPSVAFGMREVNEKDRVAAAAALDTCSVVLYNKWACPLFHRGMFSSLMWLAGLSSADGTCKDG